MRLKKFDDFLLESQLIYKGEFKNILNSVRQDNWGSPESFVADFLYNLSGKELDLVHNYIEDVLTPGLISFIPEDKLNFDKVSIEQHKIFFVTNLIEAYGIPTKGLLTKGQEQLIGSKDFPNDFKLIKTIDCDTADLTDKKLRVLGFYLYYLQSNTYPKKFVVVYRNVNEGNEKPSIYPYDIPENRRNEVKIGRFVNKMLDICKKNNVPLLEDSAQSLGSFYKNKHIGTFGDIGSFSFSAPKIISTGQGGALITNNEALSKKIYKLKSRVVYG
jgi:hypothetical protein